MVILDSRIGREMASGGDSNIPLSGNCRRGQLHILSGSQTDILPGDRRAQDIFMVVMSPDGRRCAG
ncbi:MAG: hypothetical protein SOU02_05860 [Caecibacter massiliensis]|nr:hypothetical protein [Caecibacter massiliensis]